MLDGSPSPTIQPYVIYNMLFWQDRIYYGSETLDSRESYLRICTLNSDSYSVSGYVQAVSTLLPNT